MFLMNKFWMPAQIFKGFRILGKMFLPVFWLVFLKIMSKYLCTFLSILSTNLTISRFLTFFNVPARARNLELTIENP